MTGNSQQGGRSTDEDVGVIHSHSQAPVNEIVVAKMEEYIT